MFCKWCGSIILHTDDLCDNCKRKTGPLSAHGGLKVCEEISEESTRHNKHDKRTEQVLCFLILINVLLVLLNACLLIGMEHRFSKLSAFVASNMEETDLAETVCTEPSETVLTEAMDSEQPEKIDDVNKSEDVTVVYIGS